MTRQSNETWVNIFRNVRDAQLEQKKEKGIEELIRKGAVERIDVEVVWLEGTDEWCLCCDCELFEDGFKSEQEARERLESLEKLLL